MKALITGATSGIGEAFAIKFAKLGYDLILTGRRIDLLKKSGFDISEKYNVKVEILKVELASDDDLEDLASKIRQTGDIHILVNNAGFGSGTQFLTENFSDSENMVKVQVLAPMKLIRTLLPEMVRRGSGIIINVSSISGKTPLPSGSVYSATKSFLQIFSESLYLETMHSGVFIQSLCPGFTRTDFHSKVGLAENELKNKGLVRWMSPESVVEISLKSLKQGKVICVPGFWNKVMWVLADIIPRKIYYKIVAQLYNREYPVPKSRRKYPEPRSAYQ